MNQVLFLFSEIASWVIFTIINNAMDGGDREHKKLNDRMHLNKVVIQALLSSLIE